MNITTSSTSRPSSGKEGYNDREKCAIGYTLPVIAAGEKVLAYRLDPFEATLPECIGILILIPAAEIGEMMLEDRMEGVSASWKVFGLLLFQYGSILYTHIEYYCENGIDASLM